MLTSLSPESFHPKAIASWRHTCVLAGFFLVLTLAGIVFQHRAASPRATTPEHRDMSTLYLSLILGQSGLLYYVWKGLRRTGTKLSELVGGRWLSLKDILPDAVLAAVLWIIWLLIQRGWDRLFGLGHAASLSSLLPQQPIEMALWVALSISAGFCEEVIFRGYFQRQFEALTHSMWIALLLQAVLFGISHGYQGVGAALKITLFGCLFGVFAWWRKSLRPGIIAHALSDILAVV